MNIIFMGTSEFAVPALKQIHLHSAHKIKAVFTKAPSKSGRGQNLTLSPVHEAAKEFDLTIECPKTLKSMEVLQKLRKYDADIIVVAAYGLILTKDVLESTKLGGINIHPSSLPRWRGAAPIERTIIAGDRVTAVCIMQMDEGVDTGDILIHQPYIVSHDITAEALSASLAKLGASMLINALDNYPNLPHIKQSSNGITYADKVEKEESLINWNEPADLISRKIRAFSPSGCYFEYKGEKIKIIEAEPQMAYDLNKPGIVISDNLSICCGRGLLKPIKLQRPGKKVVSLKDFLNGLNIPRDTKLITQQ